MFSPDFRRLIFLSVFVLLALALLPLLGGSSVPRSADKLAWLVRVLERGYQKLFTSEQPVLVEPVKELIQTAAPTAAKIEESTAAEIVEVGFAQKTGQATLGPVKSSAGKKSGELLVLPSQRKASDNQPDYPEELVVTYPKPRYLTRGYAKDRDDVPRWRREVIEEFKSHMPEEDEELDTFKQHVLDTLLAEGVIEPHGNWYREVEEVTAEEEEAFLESEAAAIAGSPAAQEPQAEKPDEPKKIALGLWDHVVPVEHNRPGLDIIGRRYRSNNSLPAISAERLALRLSGPPDYRFPPGYRWGENSPYARTALKNKAHPLGHGGEVCFQPRDGGKIYDENGIDFVGFENVFQIDKKSDAEMDTTERSAANLLQDDTRARMFKTGRYFVEPMAVRIADNCEDYVQGQYVQFPCAPTKAEYFRGCAGVIPTEQGGDKFDLRPMRNEMAARGFDAVGCVCFVDIFAGDPDAVANTEGADPDALQMHYAYVTEEYLQ